MRVIFLGTPEFACPVLKAITNSTHEVVAVVCQPDKPSGRGNKVIAPPAKVLANELNIPVYQFAKIRVDGVETLKSLNADIMVTAAYGQILSQEIIDICKHGIINVHGSLLPKYRGASPIQQAIIDGEKTTGVTIMKTEAGIDTGDMLSYAECFIEPNDTYGTLSEKLSQIGANLCVNALDLIESGRAVFTPQDNAKATHTKMFKKEHTIINFDNTAKQIVNLVRGLNPNPIATFSLNGENFKVFEAKAYSYDGTEPNGTILVANNKQGLVIKCQDGAVEIVEMTAPNSKRMLAKSYLNGKSLQIGSVCNG
ncbi:MAG: methionyl-tRNA formyltransferase [Clostridiales bacterium]|nr:methionyl-tRNA formyltransferase [Clostridiales bacterium]